jgi:small-conductance mechanosensitive channel
MNHQKTSLIRKIFAKILTVIFFGLAVVIVCSLLFNVVEGLLSKENVTEVFLGSINTGIIALAVFELAFIINKEYSGSIENDDKDAISSLRETLPRFIGTVCVALSLEGLIMVIKYSQLDLAGNLYYPVAIIMSTAFLLTALGLFIYLTDKRSK